MAKRAVIGSVVKSKEPGQPDYIKIGQDVTLKKGTILRLESKSQQEKNLKYLVDNNKVTGDLAEKIKERIEKMPEWVRFDIVHKDS
jgi:hypothetical protein